MAKYEIYVVTSGIAKDLTYMTFEEKQAFEQLEDLRLQLIQKFGGMTVIENTKGYWINEKGELIKDIVDIWVILTNAVITPKEMMWYGEKLRQICKQESQLISCNGTPYFI